MSSEDLPCVVLFVFGSDGLGSDEDLAVGLFDSELDSGCSESEGSERLDERLGCFLGGAVSISSLESTISWVFCRLVGGGVGSTSMVLSYSLLGVRELG